MTLDDRIKPPHIIWTCRCGEWNQLTRLTCNRCHRRRRHVAFYATLTPQARATALGTVTVTPGEKT